MHATGESPQDLSAELPGGWAEVGRYPTLRDAGDHGLVVLAMGHSYWLIEHEGAFLLLVENIHAIDARHQLGLFDRESANWPPPPSAAPPGRGERVRRPFLTPAAWCLWVALVFVQQIRWPGLLESAGALDPAAIFERGEWWRPFTALFLHAGLAHLVSNLAAGLLVFGSLVSTLGVARSWLLLLAASVAGNVFTAVIRSQTEITSIGASTAVFAGIGILTGHAMRAALRGAGRARLRVLFTPLAAGLILLGLLGAGDVRTDVVAHAAGFIMGLLAGVVAGRTPGGSRLPSQSSQK